VHPTFVVATASRLVPAKDAMDIVRGVILSGTTAADLWQPIGLLSLYTFVIVRMAVLRFKKTRRNAQGWARRERRAVVI
jgi:hypothetical protein